MNYPVTYAKKQGLTRPKHFGKTSTEIGLSPVRTQGSISLPRWRDGLFGGDLRWISNDTPEGAVDKIWVGKNITPEISNFYTDTLGEGDSILYMVKSLLFEDNRTDSYISTLDTQLGEHQYIGFTDTLKLCEGTTSLPSHIIPGREYVNASDDPDTPYYYDPYDYYGQDCPKKVWKVYLPSTITSIDFNSSSYIPWIKYGNEGDEVHFYLENNTQIPTLTPLYVPVEIPIAPIGGEQPEQPERVVDTGVNFHFYVNEDIYDDFVTAYEGKFSSIEKIEPPEEDKSWIETASNTALTEDDLDSIVGIITSIEFAKDENGNDYSIATVSWGTFTGHFLIKVNKGYDEEYVLIDCSCDSEDNKSSSASYVEVEFINGGFNVVSVNESVEDFSISPLDTISGNITFTVRIEDKTVEQSINVTESK